MPILLSKFTHGRQCLCGLARKNQFEVLGMSVDVAEQCAIHTM